jgi:hypothetical protein
VPCCGFAVVASLDRSSFVAVAACRDALIVDAAVAVPFAVAAKCAVVALIAAAAVGPLRNRCPSAAATSFQVEHSGTFVPDGPFVVVEGDGIAAVPFARAFLVVIASSAVAYVATPPATFAVVVDGACPFRKCRHPWRWWPRRWDSSLVLLASAAEDGLVVVVPVVGPFPYVVAVASGPSFVVVAGRASCEHHCRHFVACTPAGVVAVVLLGHSFALPLCSRADSVVEVVGKWMPAPSSFVGSYATARILWFVVVRTSQVHSRPSHSAVHCRLRAFAAAVVVVADVAPLLSFSSLAVPRLAAVYVPAQWVEPLGVERLCLAVLRTSSRHCRR